MIKAARNSIHIQAWIYWLTKEKNQQLIFLKLMKMM